MVRRGTCTQLNEHNQLSIAKRGPAPLNTILVMHGVVQPGTPSGGGSNCGWSAVEGRAPGSSAVLDALPPASYVPPSFLLAGCHAGQNIHTVRGSAVPLLLLLVGHPPVCVLAHERDAVCNR
eukprot:63016-Chlamydomonas_euryale.AAC.2